MHPPRVPPSNSAAMTSPQLTSALASVHAYATGNNGARSGNANDSVTVPPTTTTFTTQVPQLASEKAQSTDLFFAYDFLRTGVAAWSTRLAQEIAFSTLAHARSLSPSVEAPPIISADSRYASSLSPHGQASLHRSHLQTAGEADVTEPHAGIQKTNLEPGFVPRPALPRATTVAPTVVNPAALLASSSLQVSPSSSNQPSATSITFLQQPGGAAPHPSSETGHAITHSTGTPTPTPRTPPLIPSTVTLPPWLETDLEAFFHDHLAHAIQTRESHLVNVMHACVQQELQRQQRCVQALESQQRDSDKATSHLQSKLDRRVAETNALRKEYYKQLLMLRDLVAKQRNDPRTLRALEDVLAGMRQGNDTNDPATSSSTSSSKAGAAWLYPSAQSKAATETMGKAAATTTGMASMRKEKEKWEERARETVAECQLLQEQVQILKQQLEEAQGFDGELWFATAQHGLYERQRIIDSVYKSKCSWDHVGDSILELLNNELVWQAVSDSAYRDKTRVSRGLEALFQRAESRGVERNSTTHGRNAGLPTGLDGEEIENELAKRVNARRPGSAFLEGSRVIMCRACNGCGYLDASAAATSHQTGAPDEEDGSYLRKTLMQVLELKAALEEANAHTNQVEQQLLRTVMESAHIKERLEKIEYARAHSVDSNLQTDLDAEEEINVDEIMNAYNDASSDPASEARQGKRRGGRWQQYEHLIVELKHLLSEREAGTAELRKNVADSHARLGSLQRVAQQEQDRLQREIQALKDSLALALSSRNEEIEEKQAAVTMLLQKMDRKQSRASSTNGLVVPQGSDAEAVNADDGAASVDSNNDSIDTSENLDEDDGDFNQENEVKRSEKMARRYSQAVGRVQREHEEQQARLQHAEDALGQDSDTRKRTNSIMLGSIAVTMASHPRDLFKALSSTHQELLTFRRTSQRSSALQTDRLLTLTTHLAHISEELVMVKKRTSAEIDFWKLDCEKLQHANKALAFDFENAQRMIEEANERTAEAVARNAVMICGVCDKHQARLLAISAQLLEDSSTGGSENDLSMPRRPSSASAPTNTQLNDAERQGLGTILLDLENLYSTLSSTKQQQAKAAMARALLGADGQLNRASFSSGTGSSYDRVSFSSFARAGSQSLISASEDGIVLADEPNGAKRNSQVNSSASTGRLFQYPFSASSQRGYQTSAGQSMAQGSAVSTSSLAQENLQTHHRKTIVRTVLSEQEAFNRQRAQRRRESQATGSQNDEEQGDRLVQGQPDRLGADSHEADESNIVEPPYATYVDDGGKVVYFVDVEEEEAVESVSDEGVRIAAVSAKDTDHILASSDRRDPSTVSPSSSRLQDPPIQIPPLNNRTDGPIHDTKRDLLLLNEMHEIDKDPEVILKLRELVNHNSRAREILAVTNWSVLLSHFRASREQRRLDFVNDTWRTALASGRFSGPTNARTPIRPQAVRATMQKLVQSREFALDDAIRKRDDMRKDSRRAQAHLIHNVSTVLANLSRKSKASMFPSDQLPLVHVTSLSSPLRSPSPTHSPLRPLYPSTRINLSEIPPTQQVPTPHFQLPVELHGSSEHAIVTPRRVSPTSTSRKPCDNQESADDGLWAPSLFENDNRFPQRSIKFLPVGEGDEPSLTHSTSSFLTSTPSHSPSKSPSRSGLSVDTTRRPTHSAGPSLVGSFDMPNVDQSLDPNRPATAHLIDLSLRRPMRPQSSPAGTHARFRPSSATVSRVETELLSGEDVRPPEHSVGRPSPSRRDH